MKTQYLATKIGSIIGAICLVTTWTMVVPMLTIFPIGVPLELVFGKIFEGSSYAATSASVAISLFVLSVLVLLLFLQRIAKGEHAGGTFGLLIFFGLQLFLLHPLVFYIWATIHASSAGDGQFIMGIIATFPVSSVCFSLLGLTFDLLKHHITRQHQPANSEPNPD